VLVLVYASGGYQGNAYDLSWVGQGTTPPVMPPVEPVPGLPTNTTPETAIRLAAGAGSVSGELPGRAVGETTALYYRYQCYELLRDRGDRR